MMLPVLSAVAQRPFADESTVVLPCEKGYLYGSMLIPTGDSVETVVLFVSGGGPTDRDGNQKMMKNNAYRMLAVNLASKNIATLRYDKRGVGASRVANPREGEFELDTYISDAKAWVNFLKRDGRFKNVVMLGHGEGVLVSLVAIHEGARANGLISVAGIGRTFDQVLKDQMSDETPFVRSLANNIIDSLKADKEVKFIPFYLSSLFRPAIQPFLRSIMKFDPQKLIREVNIPTIIIQGDTDIQTKVEDARLLHAANHSSRLVIIVGMNYVMKTCLSMERMDQVTTYVNPTLPIKADLVNVISDFVNQIN